MCGIVGAIRAQNNVVDFLTDGLKRLEYRGYDSSGIAVLSEGKIKRVRRVGRVALMEQAAQEKGLFGNIGIGHTRCTTASLKTLKPSATACKNWATPLNRKPTPKSSPTPSTTNTNATGAICLPPFRLPAKTSTARMPLPLSRKIIRTTWLWRAWAARYWLPWASKKRLLHPMFPR